MKKKFDLRNKNFYIIFNFKVNNAIFVIYENWPYETNYDSLPFFT